jgi:hypothetical protein
MECWAITGPPPTISTASPRLAQIDRVRFPSQQRAKLHKRDRAEHGWNPQLDYTVEKDRGGRRHGLETIEDQHSDQPALDSSDAPRNGKPVAELAD